MRERRRGAGVRRCGGHSGVPPGSVFHKGLISPAAAQMASTAELLRPGHVPFCGSPTLTDVVREACPTQDSVKGPCDLQSSLRVGSGAVWCSPSLPQV